MFKESVKKHFKTEHVKHYALSSYESIGIFVSMIGLIIGIFSGYGLTSNVIGWRETNSFGILGGVLLLLAGLLIILKGKNVKN
jgi:hypothetical protein